MQHDLSLGFSPCPNDTFIFYALVHGRVPLSNVSLQTPVLEDVETLNSWALKARLDITKLSFHALGHVLANYRLLDAGSALGRGCGPLLVTQKSRHSGRIGDWRIAIPGKLTTAALLLRLFEPSCCRLQEMRFDRIPAAVAKGEVDGGVIIHESRFTYQEQGLVCVQDLGQWWEEETGLPIPLGCIAIRRSLTDEICRQVEMAIRESIDWAHAQPDQCQQYLREHAQEMDPSVMAGHIALYVNRFSRTLGQEGRQAVEALLVRGRAAGVFEGGLEEL